MVSHHELTGRLKSIESSGMRRFFALAEKMPPCISLGVEEPDFPPPLHALLVGWEAVKEGKTHYVGTKGVAEIREALAQKAYRDYGLYCSARRDGKTMISDPQLRM